MRNPTVILAVALIVALTILSGYMQGTMQRRWGASELESRAAARLLDFPKTLGHWTTVNESQLDETSLRMLEPSAHHVRVLENPSAKAYVSMTLLIGPPGYIGAHTPEVCVSGIGYEQLGDKEQITISVPDRPELTGTFWVATFRSRGYDRHILREYWAWSTGGPWEAASGSRMGYAGSAYLYKVQLGCRLPAGSDPAVADPTPDLLHALVAQSPDYLLTEQEAGAGTVEQPAE